MSELSPETRDLISRGRAGEELDSDRRAKMRAALLAKVAVGGAGVAAPVGVATKAVKIVIVGVLAMVGTGAVVAKYASDRSDHAVTTTAPSTIHTNAKQADFTAPSSTPTVAIHPPVSPLAAPSVDLPIASAPAISVAPPIGSSPIAIAPISTAVISSPPTNRTTNPPPRTHTTSMSENPPMPPVDNVGSGGGPGGGMGVATSPGTDDAASLVEEARLLREAHGALSFGNFQRSLTLLDDHARRFPGSALEPERSAERVFVLCQMGRTEDARAAGRDFLARHPSGPLATRVKASCAAP